MASQAVNGTSSAQAVGDLYDRADAMFRAFWGDNVHLGIWHPDTRSLSEAAQNLNAFLADFAALSASDTVCDIGSGYGATAHDLSRRCGADVTGITISAAQHSQAAQTQSARVRFVHGDWLTCGFPSDSFSALVAVESYAHMPSAESFFAVCQRVLRKGGKLVILEWHVEPHRTQESTTKRSPLLHRALLSQVRRHAQLPQLQDISTLRRLAAEAGFGITSHRDLSALVKPTFRHLVQGALSSLRKDPRLVMQLAKTKQRGSLFAAVVSTWIAFELGLLGYHAHLFTRRQEPPTGT